MKWEREKGNRIGPRAGTLNSWRPKRNRAISRHTAHVAIGVNLIKAYLKKKNVITSNNFWPLVYFLRSGTVERWLHVFLVRMWRSSGRWSWESWREGRASTRRSASLHGSTTMRSSPASPWPDSDRSVRSSQAPSEGDDRAGRSHSGENKQSWAHGLTVLRRSVMF